MSQFVPQFKEGSPALLVGVRQYHQFANAVIDIPKQWLAFNLLRQSSPALQKAISYGVVCGSDADGFEYMCAVETASFAEVDVSVGRLQLHHQFYVVLTHEGHISTIKDTWNAVWQWLVTQPYKPIEKPVFERYDERFDTSTGDGLVELWIPIIKPT